MKTLCLFVDKYESLLTLVSSFQFLFLTSGSESEISFSKFPAKKISLLKEFSQIGIIQSKIVLEMQRSSKASIFPLKFEINFFGFIYNRCFFSNNLSAMSMIIMSFTMIFTLIDIVIFLMTSIINILIIILGLLLFLKFIVLRSIFNNFSCIQLH